MAPPDTPKRRGRKRSKRRTASTGPRHTSLSEEPRPSTLPGSPAFTGKKRRGGRGKGGAGAAATETQANGTAEAMPQNENKLDNLCHLLENIIMQHGSNEVNATPRQQAKGKGPAAAGPQQPLQNAAGAGAATAVPSTSGVLTSPSHAADGRKELSKEELEQERKARKEAKKARKKAPGKENDMDSANSSQPAQQNNATPTPSAGAIPKTPVKVGAAAAAAVANSVPVAAAGPSGESSSQQGQDAAAAKSKADLRKERREKQEAQRQAKLAAKAQQDEEKKAKEKQAAEKPKTAGKVKVAGEGTTRKRTKRASGRPGGERRVPLLGHLPPYSPSPPEHLVNSDSIHPAVLSVGLKMKYGVIEGATGRVISVLSALKRFISDYRTPEACDLSRDMADKLKPNVDFLAACRPHAIAMDNAIRSVKHKINSIDPATPEAQAKDELRGAINEFVEENIILASSTIATHATSLIHDDVLLTFGYSALVCDVVEAVVKAGGQVSVVVADYPHPPSGAAMVQRLDKLGIPTYYRLVTDLSHIMSKVTKVVVEAEAVMMNGSVQALCGTASLALAAATHHKPFIVLCQTYKFCNIDLTDSLVVNELGDADSVVSCASQEHCGVLADWRETQNLNVVRLVYDVTPASLVTVLVTEQSVLPTSAVPVIIHRKYADILGQD